MSERKRVFADDDDNEAVPSPPKKPKNTNMFVPPKGDLIRNGPPSTTSNANLPSRPETTPAPPPPSNMSMTPAEIAAKRAEIAAKMAKFKIPTSAPQPPQQQQPPQHQRRPQKPSPAAPQQQQQHQQQPPPPSAPAPSLPSAPGIDPDLAKRVAEARKKVEAMASINKKPVANPYLAHLSGNSSGAAGPASSSGTSTPIKGKGKAVEVQSAEDTKANAYIDKRLGVDTLAPRERKSRSLRFVQKGKYTQLGEQMRTEQKMEELKQRILQNAKKVGLDEDMEASERQAKRQPPPEVEWWDSPFLPEESYENIDSEAAKEKIKGEGSSITLFVQHPIAIPSPKDRRQTELKPLFLTKKEMKKMRRQRRKAELQDKQDRVRMGLLPPDPPKVKLSNMMRVLTQEAVADPTKIEARVRRSMMQRKLEHEKANAERKLTDEQRREKTENKKQEDESKGIVVMGYKVKYLSHPGHKFKVRKNAEQLGLTGVVVYNPQFVLVFVEGGAKGIKKFERLMMHRIDWKETPPNEVETDDPGNPQDAPNMAENTCQVIWRGEQRQRNFQEPGLVPKACPTDAIAKEFLGPNLEGLWDVARRSTADRVGV